MQQLELPNKKAIERREAYLHFLKDVNDSCDTRFVALCAVALGRSMIKTYVEEARLHLPKAIKSEKQDLKCQVLEDVTT